MAKPNKTIQAFQQEIRSLVLNFDWETNPKWAQKWITIHDSVDKYWKEYLKRDFNNKPI